MRKVTAINRRRTAVPDIREMLLELFVEENSRVSLASPPAPFFKPRKIMQIGEKDFSRAQSGERATRGRGRSNAETRKSYFQA